MKFTILNNVMDCTVSESITNLFGHDALNSITVQSERSDIEASMSGICLIMVL